MRQRTSFAQKLPSDYSKKLIESQQYIIGLRRAHGYLLGQTDWNLISITYLDMLSNVHKKGAKSIIMRDTGNEKSRITVMLAALADERKLPPYVILEHKTLPE